MSKFLTVLLTLFVVTACSTTGKVASTDGSDPTERYNLASGNLEAFTPIKGSPVNASAHDRVFFAYDSSVVSAAGQKVLDKQVAYLKKNAKAEVTVEGHADERGTREYNLALGDRRANAVKKYLVGAGVEAARVSTISYGKERPAVLGSNEAAWAENRRAVTVLKK